MSLDQFICVIRLSSVAGQHALCGRPRPRAAAKPSGHVKLPACGTNMCLVDCICHPMGGALISLEPTLPRSTHAKN